MSLSVITHSSPVILTKHGTYYCSQYETICGTLEIVRRRSRALVKGKNQESKSHLEQALCHGGASTVHEAVQAEAVVCVCPLPRLLEASQIYMTMTPKQYKLH